MTKELKVSASTIAEWKEKYPTGVFAYTTDDGKRAYLHAPTRKTLSAAATIGKSDPLKYNEILLANCWLDGDEDIKTDDRYFLGISAKLAELVQIKEGELEKL
jgi:hypothetical protein